MLYLAVIVVRGMVVVMVVVVEAMERRNRRMK